MYLEEKANVVIFYSSFMCRGQGASQHFPKCLFLIYHKEFYGTMKTAKALPSIVKFKHPSPQSPIGSCNAPVVCEIKKCVMRPPHK